MLIFSLILFSSNSQLAEGPSYALIVSQAPAVSDARQFQSDLIVFLVSSKMRDVVAFSPAAHSSLQLVNIDGKLKETNVLVRPSVGHTQFQEINPLSAPFGFLSLNSFFDMKEEINGVYRFKVRYDDSLPNWSSKTYRWGKQSVVGKLDSPPFFLTIKKSKIIGFKQGAS